MFSSDKYGDEKGCGKDFIYTLMTESTSGICLHYYKYSDSSVVQKYLQKSLVLRSFVLKGVRGKKSKNKINLLQSLNIVQLEFTNNNKRQLQYVKEINKSDKFPI